MILYKRSIDSVTCTQFSEALAKNKKATNITFAYILD